MTGLAASLRARGQAAFSRRRPALAAAAAVFAILAALPLTASAQSQGASFDHLTTGFPLTGAHELVRCETCHIKAIFKGTAKQCADCHMQNNQRGAVAKPVAHIQTTESCDSCHTTASFTGGTFSHVTVVAGTCAKCHNGIRAVGKPVNHLPTTLSCDDCHLTSTFSRVGRFDHSGLNGVLTTCASCHDGRQAKGQPPNHIVTPDPTLCGTCHVASTQTGFTSFAGGQMNHAGITSGCSTCHGPDVLAGTFAGITSIVVLPPTSPAGPTSHIPSSLNCESCHLASLPAGTIAANTARLPPGSGFSTPPPGNPQIHGGVTSGCNVCHDSNLSWIGVGAYPISPTAVTAGAQYLGFQTRPLATAGTFRVADPAHPSSGDCSDCHVGTSAFVAAQSKPANHIPYAAGATCSACHTSADFSVMPTLANIHTNAQSTTGNCTQCHGAAAASFAIPAAGFSIVGLPGNHLPTSASCESCHIGQGSSIAAVPVGNGAKFSGSLMSHTGITSNCVACHGPGVNGSSFVGVGQIVVMPPTSPVGVTSHIPSGTSCETCHLATIPFGPVPAAATKTAPGTAFATPAPTTTQIHAGVTSGCSSCHDSTFVWMGMAAYPIAPTVLTAAAQYTGFQTRPRAAGGTYNIADAAHPSSGDCAQCHSGTNFFTVQDKPANHIPYAAAAQCSACHTTPGDFATIPTFANIHANAQSTTSNCAQCHGAAAASFAMPAAGFSIVGLPGNHIPTTASCETCHVGAGSSIAATPVGNGARFSGSKMSHAGIASNCVACHGPAINGSSFAGVTSIVVMPVTSPAAAMSHIPSSTTCEICHLATVPAGQIAAVATKTAPGTAFANPAPTTAQIHTGVTSGCSSCHEASYVWMGMAAYPIAPTVLTTGAQYTGFQTRPRTAAGTFNVADAAHPATGDCSQCHSGTTFSAGTIKPNGHIPTTLTTCSTCHVVSGDFSVAGLTANFGTLHTGITSNCIACHSAGTGAGPFAGCATQAACSAPLPISYQPKTPPLAGGGSPTAPSSATHVPTVGISCEKCHSASAFTTFAGMNMKGNSIAHTAVGAATCESCHEFPYVWFGVTIQTPGSASHHGRSAGQDCISSGCHNRSYAQFSNRARVRPVLRAAVAGADTRFLPDGTTLPARGSGQAFDHQGVLPGQCRTCHNGQAARTQPAQHLVTRASCDTCHRTTAWTPAQFSHAGVLPGQCQTCHNGSSAPGKMSGHFVSARSCDACHRTIGWIPVNYSHISPLYRAAPDKPTCVSCHVTNGEIIPRQLRGGPRPRPVPGS